MTERDAAIRVLCRCAETAPDASDLRESVAAVRDWDALIDLAVHHGVIGLAARTLANLDGALPSGAARRFEEQRRSLQRRGLAAAAETVRLLRVLGDAGVEALPLKGPSLAAQAYGDTGARDYGDIDLLVRRALTPRWWWPHLRTSRRVRYRRGRPSGPLRGAAAGRVAEKRGRAGKPQGRRAARCTAEELVVGDRRRLLRDVAASAS